MTQTGWLKLCLILIILLAVWPESPALAASTGPRLVEPGLEIPGVGPHAPCAGFFQSSCRPEIWLIVGRWLAARGLRWDRSQWGLPVYIEFDQAAYWQRVSVLCLHLVRQSS